MQLIIYPNSSLQFWCSRSTFGEPAPVPTISIVWVLLQFWKATCSWLDDRGVSVSWHKESIDEPSMGSLHRASFSADRRFSDDRFRGERILTDTNSLDTIHFLRVGGIKMSFSLTEASKTAISHRPSGVQWEICRISERHQTENLWSLGWKCSVHCQKIRTGSPIKGAGRIPWIHRKT